MGTYSITFDLGVSSQTGQILRKPLRYYRENNAFVIRLNILNERSGFAQGREAGQLNPAPEIYVHVLYDVSTRRNECVCPLDYCIPVFRV